MSRALDPFFGKTSVWVPRKGENREAGVNPARSRHCDEKPSTVFLSQETCPSALQPFNTRARCFRPHTGFILKSR